MDLFTNSSGADTIRAAFIKYAKTVSEINIATPFFSYDSILSELLNREALIRLIVRLGPATAPKSLKKLIGNNKVQIRYFTSSYFHSKLYIFGDQIALVGSANLTESGFQSNREICVGIERENEIFDRLVSLFNTYWNQADVLSQEGLKKYVRIYDFYNSAKQDKLEDEIIKTFGDISPSEGIQTDKKNIKKEIVFLKSYSRTYQEFLHAYKEVENLYNGTGKRKKPEIPIRIEIDQFFSFIREEYAIGEKYKLVPLLHDANKRKQIVTEKINEWLIRDWPYLNNYIPTSVSTIDKYLSSPETIESLDTEKILKVFDVCHSFHDRFRFYKGGHETLNESFLKDNEEPQIKKVLQYLIFGHDDFITRMGNCIYNEEYKLNWVARSVIQEMLGWANKEGIPICNGRTVKSLRYLGYDVAVFT